VAIYYLERGDSAVRLSAYAPTCRAILIITRLVNFCWLVFQWGLALAVVVALAVGSYLYLCLDDEILRHIEHRLAGHYRGLAVDVGAARFEQDRGITIYDIEVAKLGPDGGNRPLVAIKELFLAGKMRPNDLLAGAPRVEQIVVRRATLQATRRPNGDWNIADLLPLPRFSDHCPEIHIENATIVVTISTAAGPRAITLANVNLTFTPLSPSSSVASLSDRGRYHVTGTAAGLPARELHLVGEVGTHDRSMNINARIAGLEVTPTLLTQLPLFPAHLLHDTQVACHADLALRVRRTAAESKVDWSASATIDHGRFAHRLLPEPLSDVSATVLLNAKRVFVQSLRGTYGRAGVSLACDRAGWARSAPLALSAQVTGLMMDERLQAALPESLARVWRRFEPVGMIDAQLRLTFDGQAWSPHVVATCRDLSLTDNDKFPYRLRQATGVVRYTPSSAAEPDRLQMDLTAVGGGRPVRVAADLTHVVRTEGEGEAVASGLASDGVTIDLDRRATGYRGVLERSTDDRPAPHPIGWVEISGTDIPLHEQLVAAIPESGNAQALVRSLNAHGAIDFLFRVEWKTRSQPRAERSQDIVLKDCTIQFDKFRYRLSHVHGRVTERSGQWILHGIQGRGGGDLATMKCRGRATPKGAGHVFDLVFDATSLPLDDHLRDALPRGVQQAWQELQPHGRVNFAAHVVHETGQAEPAIELTLEPCERSVSIQPLKFPYRLEEVDGVAQFQADRVDIANLRAVHDRVECSAAAGTWQPTADGGWQLDLRGVNIDRVAPHRDRALLAALPPTVRRIMERLQPVGTFDVHNSSVTFAKSPQSNQLAAKWDVQLECFQAALPGALPLESMSGGIRLVGRCDAQAQYTMGELDLASVTWKDMQFTNVRGPLWIDRSFVLLGEAAAERQRAQPRRMTADAYGGSLTANAACQHDAHSNYSLDVTLGGVSLARFVSERLGGPQDMAGTISGTLRLSGTGKSAQSLHGGGELRVVDANIYELPMLVRLLKVLRNRTPTTTAFNQCEMQFAVQGERVQFQKLNLLGDAVSLYGNGETNFNRELDLVFYTLIGPADLPIPLWKTIAGQVSQQGLQLKVAGRWDNPEVESEPFPAVNEIIQQIQAGAATMAPTTAVRDALTPARR
jgi:hypothetical protein